MPRKHVVKIHISLIDGIWYAMPGNNNYMTRACLVPAISYCRRMNEKQKRKVYKY